MTVQIIESTNNPFSDYFQVDNPSYHKLINKFYYKSYELIWKNNSVLITEFRKNRDKQSDEVMYYFCGYDDYFYHFHVFEYARNFDVLVVDIKGWGYNKRYCSRYPYPVESKFNYYDNASYIVENLEVAFSFCKKKYDFKNSYLYSHSTGCNIVNTYLYYLQNNKQPIEFTKVFLCSPLTRFYDPSPIKLLLLIVLSLFLGIFTKNFDLNALINGANKRSDKSDYNRALNSIHGTKGLNYIHNGYTGDVAQPKLSGWINYVESSTNIMKLGNVKIDCDVSLVCSETYGTTGYFQSDQYLNPQYILEDIKCIYKNPKVKQFRTTHDCLITPYDNGNNINFKDVLDFLFA